MIRIIIRIPMRVISWRLADKFVRLTFNVGSFISRYQLGLAGNNQPARVHLSVRSPPHPCIMCMNDNMFYMTVGFFFHQPSESRYQSKLRNAIRIQGLCNLLVDFPLRCHTPLPCACVSWMNIADSSLASFGLLS